jgi:potassium-transporting ATPase ATP-binding subunit
MNGLYWVLEVLLVVELAFLGSLLAGWILSELVSRKPKVPLQVDEKSSGNLREGDVVRVQAGQLIPGDGEVVQGVAGIDESAITGVSTIAIREAGGSCPEVVGGTQVVSGSILVRIGTRPR